MTPQDTMRLALEQAYERGWIEAACWAQRDDLCADVGSPAYINDRAPHLDAVEAALSQQWEQQPVAWMEQEWAGSGLKHLHFERPEPTVRDEVVCPVWTPLYAGAAPAARQGEKPITDAEIDAIADEFEDIVAIYWRGE